MFYLTTHATQFIYGYMASDSKSVNYHSESFSYDIYPFKKKKFKTILNPVTVT